MVHRQARFRGDHRCDHGRQRFPLGDRGASGPSGTGGHPHGAQSAARRAHGRGHSPRAGQWHQWRLGLRTPDCQKAFEELSDKGVEFVQPPSERPYGVEAVCRDNSGNWLVLVEPRAFDPSQLK
ncbi:VOC family protein [Nocardia crassostreae]|uniref:VOC family protein n=1 Tax=Nocardia crassostreae TaxID=53428 RepID=UPI00350E4EAD